MCQTVSPAPQLLTIDGDLLKGAKSSKVEAFAFELQSHAFLLVLWKFRIYQSAALMNSVCICEMSP